MIECQYNTIMDLLNSSRDEAFSGEQHLHEARRAMGYDHEDTNHHEALRRSQVALELLKEATAKTEQLIVELEKA